MPKSYSDYTVAIICAMSFEMSAVRYMLDKEDSIEPPRQPGDPNTYVLGEMRGHNVVLAWLPSQQGKGAAAIVATNLSRTFGSIKLRLMVGIGGGVPSPENDVRLGDVVIAMPQGQYGGVVQYDLGKETENDDPSQGFILKGFLKQPPQALIGIVELMKSDYFCQDNKIDKFVGEMLGRGPRLAAFKRPFNDSDILFQADYAHVRSTVPGVRDPPCKHNCDESKVVERGARDEPSKSVIHYGLIASGDSVIKSTARRDELSRRVGGDVLCFEMEAAGLMTGFECLVVRGVSDYCDSHKNDVWHHYAAAAAAACAKEILERLGPDSKETSRSASQATEPGDGERAAPPMSNDGASNPGGNQSNSLSGTGIQNTGGNFSVGGSVSIGQGQAKKYR